MLTRRACLLSFASAPLALHAADILRQGERDIAMSHMHASRKFFLDSVAGLSPAQWSFKAAPERWSIAECAEHIAASETFIWGLVEKLGASPDAPPEMIEKTKGKDKMVIELVPKRDQKFQAPEPIQPKHISANPQEYVDKFKASRDQHIRFLETAPTWMRARVAPHPAMKELDAYQWVLLISAHTERHTHQILEVKADPKYPKK